MSSPRVSSPYSTASVSSGNEDHGRSPSPVMSSHPSNFEATSTALKEIFQRSQEAKDIYRLMAAASNNNALSSPPSSALNLSKEKKDANENEMKASSLLALSKLPSGISGLSIPPAGGLISPFLQSSLLQFGLDHHNNESSKLEQEKLSSLRLALASRAREMFAATKQSPPPPPISSLPPPSHPYREESHPEEGGRSSDEDCNEAQDLRIKKRKLELISAEDEESDAEIDVSNDIEQDRITTSSA